MTLERPQHQRQTYLDAIIEETRIESGEGCNLVEPIAQRIAMNREFYRSGRRATILSKEDIKSFNQLGGMVKRAEEMRCQVNLGLLVSRSRYYGSSAARLQPGT